MNWGGLHLVAASTSAPTPRSESKEGLAQQKGVLAGEEPPELVEIEEGRPEVPGRCGQRP